MKTAENNFSDTGLVIVAGGSGSRFGGGRNKLLVDLDGLPVLAHSLRRFGVHLPPGHFVLVVSDSLRKEAEKILTQEELAETVRIIKGGCERQDSVVAGLNALPETCTIAAIHDAARPRAGLELLCQCVKTARLHGSGVAAIRMRDTVKQVDADGVVQQTLDRSQLCATETPQVFQRELILEAYRKVAEQKLTVTDDAQAVELTGGIVHLVIHESDNRKITVPSDIIS